MIPIKERFEIILKELEEKGAVKVSQLSGILECSEVTIRSDIAKLDEQKLLKKTYGGAVKREEHFEIALEPGEVYLNRDKKYRIAQRAYSYINNRDSVILDDSTTAYYLAQCIRENDKKRVVVVTNSIAVAAVLSNVRQAELFLIGGGVIGNPPSALDNIAVNFLDQFHVDKAFVGVNGINLKIGLTSIGSPQMEVKKKMIKVSQETYVIADSSKFGNGNLFTVCPIDKIDRIITDADVSDEILKLADELNVKIETV